VQLLALLLYSQAPQPVVLLLTHGLCHCDWHSKMQICFHLALYLYTVSPHYVSTAFPLPFPCIHKMSEVEERFMPFSVGGEMAFPCILLHFNHWAQGCFNEIWLLYCIVASMTISHSHFSDLQVVDVTYGLFVWPCATLLAKYIFHRRDAIVQKHILEVNSMHCVLYTSFVYFF